jgi:hypothetical protein
MLVFIECAREFGRRKRREAYLLVINVRNIY